MIKACVFDLDGTLLDTLTTIAYYGNLALNKFGMESIETDKYKYFVGNGAKILVERMLREKNSYSDEMFDYAESRNLILIPGIEISTKWNKCGIHVLGYNFDINDDNLREELIKFININYIMYETWPCGKCDHSQSCGSSAVTLSRPWASN